MKSFVLNLSFDPFSTISPSVYPPTLSSSFLFYFLPPSYPLSNLLSFSLSSYPLSILLSFLYPLIFSLPSYLFFNPLTLSSTLIPFLHLLILSLPSHTSSPLSYFIYFLILIHPRIFAPPSSSCSTPSSFLFPFIHFQLTELHHDLNQA